MYTFCHNSHEDVILYIHLHLFFIGNAYLLMMEWLLICCSPERWMMTSRLSCMLSWKHCRHSKCSDLEVVTAAVKFDRARWTTPSVPACNRGWTRCICVANKDVVIQLSKSSQRIKLCVRFTRYEQENTPLIPLRLNMLLLLINNLIKVNLACVFFFPRLKKILKNQLARVQIKRFEWQAAGDKLISVLRDRWLQNELSPRLASKRHFYSSSPR